MNKQLQRTKAEIEELVTFKINGYDSQTLIRGTKSDNPILLFVHGLGYSDMMFSRCYDQGLLDEFTVVRYDQRGVGKSTNKSIPDSFLSIENYVSDLLCITDSIQMRFPHSEIYLTGHSWGTVLGLIACQRASEKYYCYIGMGQIVNQKEADKISYDFAIEKAKEKNHTECIAILEKLNSETYNRNHESLILQRKCLKKMGGTFVSSDIENEMKKCVLKSPEHGLFELLSTPKKAKRIDKILFPQILEVNFFETIPSIEIPVFFIGGRHDYMVPSVLSNKYLDSLQAPMKRFIWFEKSGHLPIYEENEIFIAELKKIKRNLHTTMYMK